MQRVPYDKIQVLRNGVDISLFKPGVEKNPNKVIFSSSPDRGLERAIEIVKRARSKYPDLELHAFYGTGNMRKMGMTEEADRADKAMADNSFVKFHGFVPKRDLIKHFQESVCWIYCADFIETSCITAMEAMLSGCYPLVRNMGALRDTLSEAVEKDCCTILDQDGRTDEDFAVWSDELCSILADKKWEKIDISAENYSWSKVAGEFIEALNLAK
jgi:glycosyltransferase involved in cell wall biosynthesis